jgi:hypothetical protein
MAKTVSTKEEKSPTTDELLILEAKKVKALEKIANSLDALTIWFEEIDKDEWSARLQWYLSEFHKLVPKEEVTEENQQTEENA